AQAEPVRSAHTEAELVSEVTSIQPGTPFWAGLHLKMEPRWHTYWRNPGDSGLPTQIKWNLPEGFEAGALQWPQPEKVDLPPLAVYAYENEVLLPVQITPPASLTPGQDIELKAKATWLACEEVCIPGQAELSLHLPVKAEVPAPDPAKATVFAETRARFPLRESEWRAEAFTGKKQFVLRITSPNAYLLSGLSFFPYDEKLIDHAAPQTARKIESGYELILKRGNLFTGKLDALEGILVSKEGWRGAGSETSLEIKAPVTPRDFPESAGGAPMKLGAALVFAFLGGLILNLMPCVFPVLSIKILNFVEQASEQKIKPGLHGIAFTAGVLVSFWLLAGALIFFRAAGHEIGWGFQLQSPVFVGFLAVLFLILSLSLFGFFEIGLSLTGLGGFLTGKSGLGNSFFGGVLATVIATPCTAPFMGAALGFALTQPPAVSLAVFTLLGLGMAFPYLLLSFFPRLLAFVPRPGPWMSGLKKFMGVLLLATAAWLGWIFFLQSGAHVTTPGHGGKIAWETYSDERLASLRASGTPVFVDFTAAWCLTCKVNEKIALDQDRVKKKFEELKIVPLKADWTSRDERIARALAGYGRSSIPLYVLYGPGHSEPVLLPEIITADLVVQAVDKVFKAAIDAEKKPKEAL
ncbi:MAG TPA: protein-disulfide reductase DsbD domain-containing protein, partial [Verrucomicrobiae bacterium]|nr:protein-disulfide reductase DsbD domain-containing protein [Verrucomicrobiae bacterium]